MIISVKTAQPTFKKTRNQYLGNYIRGQKYLHVLTGDTKNKILGPSGPS